MTIDSPIAILTPSLEPVGAKEAELRILLVDDDARYLKLCKRYLGRSTGSKFKIHSVASLKAAVQCCTSNEFDCLVVDYLLPDGTGTGLINLLKQNSNRTPPPTVITTADGGENAATEAIRAGAVDFISKRNLNSHSLSRSIRNAVEKFRLTESLKSRNVELVEANSTLRRNRKEIMQFYHTVSHEVKTPLAAAREFVSLVQDGAEGDINDSQKHLLQLAIDSCDQIKNQFTDLLDMTRLESGKLELKCSVIDVEDMVSRSIGAVSELARTKNVTIINNSIAGIKVSADSDRIVQVLSNLMHNAVKFSDEGSEVILRTQLSLDASQLAFRVEDSGCGIAHNELESVFDRLYQSEHKRLQSSANGLGLGLAISRDIVSLHGGTLVLHSELNVGSSFSFELPVAKDMSLKQ